MIAEQRKQQIQQLLISMAELHKDTASTTVLLSNRVDLKQGKHGWLHGPYY